MRNVFLYDEKRMPIMNFKIVNAKNKDGIYKTN